MTDRGIAVLGVRLLALYLFVQVLTELPDLYALLMGARVALDSTHYGLLLAAQVGPGVVGLLLWFGAGGAASLLLPQRTVAPRPPLSSGGWYGPAFAAVGLWVAIDALPELLRLAADAHRHVLALEDLGFELRVAIAGAALRVVLGLCVLLGSRGFANLVARLRTSGWQQAVSS